MPYVISNFQPAFMNAVADLHKAYEDEDERGYDILFKVSIYFLCQT